MEGVRRAKANNATVLSIVNKPGSILERASDKTVYINCGPEVCVAATKSFMNQLAIFYMLSFAMVDKLDEAVQQITEISSLLAENIGKNGKMIGPLAKRIKDKEHCYYIARGINFAIASEGALKLKEVSYIHAEGMPAGELKHGTLALIEKGTPIIALCPDDYTHDEMISNIEEAKSRGAYIVGVSDKNDDIFDQWLEIPQVKEIFYPLVSVVPLQLLAYHLAVSRGKDPDKPRNLAKSVTVR